ncbi:MAG: hypothetical protein NTW52_07695 [Planctomycetota bacterium]|nr:hypothetical protein [Planctomycetota bacterium]
MVSELNEALVEQRISKTKRRQICTSFVYSLCNTLDQRWVRIDGQTYFPLLAFSKTFFDIGDSIESVAPIQMPDRDVAFYEMLGDETDWLFDECKEVTPPSIYGGIGQELPDEELPPEPEPEKLRIPCHVCNGTGKCFCLRKGPGNSAGCPRCATSGNCRHCGGTGVANHGLPCDGDRGPVTRDPSHNT